MGIVIDTLVQKIDIRRILIVRNQLVQFGINTAVEYFEAIKRINSEKKHNNNYDRKLDEQFIH